MTTDDTTHEATDTPDAADVDELGGLADLTAHEASAFLTAVTEVASGNSPDTAIPLLTLALSQVLVAGSRLGAIQDVVLEERYEADPGPDDDPDPLRDGLANLLAGIDEYVYVIDPVTSPERADGSITNDLADIALALTHGLKHYQAGRKVEALWWWQFSYLSVWGDRALASMRALHSILSHLRLDADEERVSEAEFDALHP
ncbi:MAG TPA: DUF5063 domain-containing protein [Intrasporangium sp.]|uniref:DUF5063 domain-containing protein n=1 Tax=Intrasporangium sp. TaxID=1925024 RepID=UPI002B4918E1|nr:DUF5063 domain-containing protein [Intrasporangium sp.]HKX66579.1 DUF5063 domain-containing protein [Intrasporangium sp.]